MRKKPPSDTCRPHSGPRELQRAQRAALAPHVPGEGPCRAAEGDVPPARPPRVPTAPNPPRHPLPGHPNPSGRSGQDSAPSPAVRSCSPRPTGPEQRGHRGLPGLPPALLPGPGTGRELRLQLRRLWDQRRPIGAGLWGLPVAHTSWEAKMIPAFREELKFSKAAHKAQGRRCSPAQSTDRLRRGSCSPGLPFVLHSASPALRQRQDWMSFDRI